MRSSIAFAPRGRLQGLRQQLALLDREFDDLVYETLRVLDADSAPAVLSMEILSYRRPALLLDLLACGSGALQQASSSLSPEKQLDISTNVGCFKGISEDELTCSICLELVNAGELIRSLPCLHQHHADCIDPWLKQQGTCPVCKFKIGSGWHEDGDLDASFMV